MNDIPEFVFKLSITPQGIPRKVQAIKELRDATNWCLMHSKQFCEFFYTDNFDGSKKFAVDEIAAVFNKFWLLNPDTAYHQLELVDWLFSNVLNKCFVQVSGEDYKQCSLTTAPFSSEQFGREFTLGDAIHSAMGVMRMTGHPAVLEMLDNLKAEMMVYDMTCIERDNTHRSVLQTPLLDVKKKYNTPSWQSG